MSTVAKRFDAAAGGAEMLAVRFVTTAYSDRLKPMLSR